MNKALSQTISENKQPTKHMFGLFKKKSEKERLNDRYKKLMEEAHKLSHSNRREADNKYAEAEAIALKMEQTND